MKNIQSIRYMLSWHLIQTRQHSNLADHWREYRRERCHSVYQCPLATFHSHWTLASAKILFFINDQKITNKMWHLNVQFYCRIRVNNWVIFKFCRRNVNPEQWVKIYQKAPEQQAQFCKLFRQKKRHAYSKCPSVFPAFLHWNVGN